MVMFGILRKGFFFEKKKQKTSDYCGICLRRCHSPQDKVFLLLFVHKKKGLLSFPLNGCETSKRGNV
jgi:hypothetical protein